MKRLLFIIIPLIFFGCKNTIAYELRNHTTYDIILVDTKHVDNPEYFVKANTTITIDHTSNGQFELKNNTYPIEVYDGFIYTEVRNLLIYDLNIFNNSDKSFLLKILNTSHNSTQQFTISASLQDTISIYCNDKPIIKLYYNNSEYNNYVIRDNNLIIY